MRKQLAETERTGSAVGTEPCGIILKDPLTHLIPNENKTLVSFASQVTNPLLIMIYNILSVAFLDVVPALRKTRVRLIVEGENCMMGRI